MTNQEFIQQAKQAEKIMLELCEKLDACYEKHLKADAEQGRREAA